MDYLSLVGFSFYLHIIHPISELEVRPLLLIRYM